VRRRCIVFDLDDTLYLERDYVRSGFTFVGRWAAEELGLASFGDEAWKLFENGWRNGVFEAVLRNYGRDPEPSLVARLVNIYRAHSPEISLLPDAEYCLKEVGSTVLTGLITDGTPSRQSAKCRRLGLQERLRLIVCTGIWGMDFGKPHIRAFEFFEGQFGRDCTFVYVADNPLKDFQAPIAMGWKTVRVRRAQGLHYHIECALECQPTLEVPDMWNLSEILDVQMKA
jgi:putative hydrolase of the HAD superfamily